MQSGHTRRATKRSSFDTCTFLNPYLPTVLSEGPYTIYEEHLDAPKDMASHRNQVAVRPAVDVAVLSGEVTSPQNVDNPASENVICDASILRCPSEGSGQSDRNSTLNLARFAIVMLSIITIMMCVLLIYAHSDGSETVPEGPGDVGVACGGQLSLGVPCDPVKVASVKGSISENADPVPVATFAR